MPLRLALVRDFRAELWPSMDLVADQLLAHLPPSIEAVDVAPPFHRAIGRLPFLRRAGFNADRLVNRHVLLPRAVRRAVRDADFVHVVDHSYAHLVNAVPPGRAGVYCHDLDAFRSLLEPEKERRPWWFRKVARRTLDGLKQAAVVFHSTTRVGEQLAVLGVVPAAHLVLARYGVSPEFTPVAPAPVELPVAVDSPFLLNVGGAMPRKRLDVLLDVFAHVRGRVPGLRLVQVGGPWPPHLAEQITRLGIGSHITQVRGLSREQLAELYRKASAVLVTSEAEGFGLPVIEALACGSVVISSDLPTLREAGGDGASYCRVADIGAWSDVVVRLMRDPASAPPRETRLAHAALFSWREHARVIADAYLRLANG